MEFNSYYMVLRRDLGMFFLMAGVFMVAVIVSTIIIYGEIGTE